MANGWWIGATNTSWSGTGSGARWRDALVGGSALADVNIPNATTDVASFNNSGLTAARTVYMNGNKTVLGLTFTTYNRGTNIIGGISGTPASNQLNLGTSGINASADSAYFFVTASNVTVALTTPLTPFTIPSTNASYVSGPMTGTGFGIKKESGGHLVFNGTGKTYTGQTYVAGGVLFLQTTLTVPSAGTTALTVDSGAAVSISTTNVYGTSTNNYLWNVAGAVNSESGSQWLPIGLTLTNGSLGGSSTSTLGAFHVASGRTSTITGYGLITSTVGLIGSLATSVTSGQTMTFSNVIGTSAANTGSLSKNGAGTLTLSGANAYTGGTTLSDGTVSIGNNAAFGTGAITLSGVSLQPNDTTSRAIANNLVVTGSTTNNLFTGSNFADLLFYGTGSGAGTVVVNSSVDRSTWLQGSWASFTGTVQHVANTNGMLLRLGGTPGSQSSNTSTNGSFFQLAKFSLSGTGTNRGIVWCGQPGTAVQIGELSGTGGRLDVGLAATSQANWQIGALNTDSTYAGTINGTNSLTKVGTGKLTLTGASDFSGGTTLSAGTLALGNDAALGTGTLTISGSSTLDATADRAITNAMSIGSSFTVAGANTLTQSTGGIALTTSPTITVSASTLTLNGVVSGTGRALTKAGSGTLSLANASNTYSGGTNINEGTLSFASGGLGSSGTISMQGGTLQYTTGNTQDVSGRLSSIGSQTWKIDTNGNNVTFASLLSGASAVEKYGSGSLALTNGSSVYGSGTNVYAGTLVVGASSSGTVVSGPIGTNIISMYGGALDATGADRTLANALSIRGSFSFVGTRNLTFTAANTVGLPASNTITVSSGTLTIAGQISDFSTGPNVLTKAGSGTLLLSGNTGGAWTGGCVVSAGLLKAGNTNALGTGAASVASGATLAALASISGKLDIGGTLTNSGGTLRIGGT